VNSVGKAKTKRASGRPHPARVVRFLAVAAASFVLGLCHRLEGAALSADLSVKKYQIPRIPPTPVLPGQLVNFVILVSNAGPNDASNVVIEDVLPPNTTLYGEVSGPDFDCPHSVVGGKVTVTCKLTTLPASTEYGPFSISLRVSPGSAGSIVNTATVSSDTPDPDLTNNSSTVVTEIGPSIPVSGVALVGLGLAITAAGILRLEALTD